ncbi:MAG: ferredoxin reductase [Gemmatimonadota bacterium]|nr:ferredoxin reductase [Gemmatimonadota bacterium]
MTSAPALVWQEAVIERIEQQTPRVKSFFLRVPLARSQAGQHVDVRLTAPDGYSAQRSYSIASLPGEDTIELALERLEDGEVSTFLHDVAVPGDTIELRGPIGGHFIWRADLGGPLLLIAGGSGVAPLMSILRARGAFAPGTRALLVYSARTWDDLIFRDQLLEMERTDPHVELVVVTTREAPRRPGDLGARLDGSALREILTTWGMAPAHVYVCGATAFVELVTRALVSDGVPPERVRTERYGGTA